MVCQEIVDVWAEYYVPKLHEDENAEHGNQKKAALFAVH
jgi:hypothetical protein